MAAEMDKKQSNTQTGVFLCLSGQIKYLQVSGQTFQIIMTIIMTMTETITMTNSNTLFKQEQIGLSHFFFFFFNPLVYFKA